MNQAQVFGQLRKAIIEELCVKRWFDVWFFPERNGVTGWCGTAPIMLVGLNPSMGTFPSKAVCLLYDSLSQNGLSDAHITDLLKIRLNGKSVQESFAIPELVRLHSAWLMEEVRILDPYLIVALGHKAFDCLRAWLPNKFHPRIVEIHHYSWAHRYGKDEVFTQDVAKIRDMYLKSIRQSVSPNQGIQRDAGSAGASDA